MLKFFIFFSVILICYKIIIVIIITNSLFKCWLFQILLICSLIFIIYIFLYFFWSFDGMILSIFIILFLIFFKFRIYNLYLLLNISLKLLSRWNTIGKNLRWNARANNSSINVREFCMTFYIFIILLTHMIILFLC